VFVVDIIRLVYYLRKLAYFLAYTLAYYAKVIILPLKSLMSLGIVDTELDGELLLRF
jgi:uncharacterized membrane protein